MKLTKTGQATVIAEGYIAYGESNKSDGLGPLVELDRYSTIEEALNRVRGEGDNGEISSFKVVLYTGGLTETLIKRIYGRRKTPSNTYTVGFLDLREFNENI